MRPYIVAGVVSVLALMALFFVGSYSSTGAMTACVREYSYPSGMYAMRCGVNVGPASTVFPDRAGSIQFVPSDEQVGLDFGSGESYDRRISRADSRARRDSVPGRRTSISIRGEDSPVFDSYRWSQRQSARQAYADAIMSGE